MLIVMRSYSTLRGRFCCRGSIVSTSCLIGIACAVGNETAWQTSAQCVLFSNSSLMFFVSTVQPFRYRAAGKSENEKGSCFETQETVISSEGGARTPHSPAAAASYRGYRLLYVPALE